MQNNRLTRSNFWTPLLISFLLSVVFCLSFSISTSPFYTHYGYDSIIFRLIGKYWAEGILPYVGLWDHKGPYIFFIDCLGYSMHLNLIGVFLVQVIHLSFTLFFIYCTFSLWFSKSQSWLFTLLSLIWLICCFDEGNLTEEFLLPWISATIFYTIRWVMHQQSVHYYESPFFILSGIVLGLAFMTRLTSALITCGISLFFFFHLILSRRWKDVIKSAALFILGISVSVLPFIVYFELKGALGEMWWGTFVVNYQLATKHTIGFLYKKEILLNVILMGAPFSALSILSAFQIVFHKESRNIAILGLLSTIPYLIWMSSSNHFTHYLMVTIPMIPLLLYIIRGFFSSRFFRTSIVSLAVSGTILGGISFYRHLNVFNYAYMETIAEQVKVTIPEEERFSFQAWNIHPSIYELLDIKPLYPHFVAHSWHGSLSNNVRDAIVKEFSSADAEWLLVSKDDYSLIETVLNDSYYEYASYSTNTCLYKKRD